MRPLHCPTCIWCGARLIHRILALKGVRPAAELSHRASTALATWVAHGHDEQQLRTLCASGCLIQPLQVEPAPEVPKKPAPKRR